MIDDRECQARFAKFIRDGREARQLYQSQVAEKIGISQQAYSLFESGERGVDLVRAMKICEILHLNIHEFIDTYF